MKNKLFRISLALFAALGMLSCDVEPIDDGLGGQDLPTNDVFFAANYGSVNYKTDQASAKVEGGILQVQAVHPNGVFLIKNQGALTGTYVNGQTDFTFIEAATGKTFSSKHPITGENISTFSITSINFDNQSISGTFQFVGYRMADTTIPDTDEGAQARMDLPDGEFPDLDIPEEVMPGVEQLVFSQGTMLNIPYGAGIIDPVDPNDPNFPDDPSDPSSGDYFPMAVGNIWNYTNIPTDPAKIISTQTINGKIYYRMTGAIINAQDLTDDAQDFVRKENGNYYARVNYPSLNQSIEMILLKDYLNEGQGWEEEFTITMVGDEPDEVMELIVSTTSVIESKGSYTVNNINYPDVIKVAAMVDTEFLYNGEPFGDQEPPLLHEYWYAKDVGLIKLKIAETIDEPEELHELIDYTLF
ncbi:MAG TPA: DUF6252 family protein [Flavobacterium sp.]|nr:DUF6252 family protein [Flavobacterium sp.]